MDVNYPVYDPNSNKYWIGELIKYTADPKHYPNHTIGHFPIKAVQPSDIYLDQQAKASAKSSAYSTAAAFVIPPDVFAECQKIKKGH